ncbi:MAG: hypothetical protein N2Z23_01705 [Pyrinomonadaceae bacterium]|nr:hypothetical protein [Pyrinomonadaceae bacterium]MCX7639146.1 hypothetical protein [Pyrinomonadaceae bacterium]MDW8303633.1 hypothetical protein [Acidobacteriota bacterium]
MKRKLKKVLILLFLIVLLSQTPFIYRRYELAKLSEEIARINSQRKELEAQDRYADYKGIIHVHTNLGGHSTGHFEELIKAAQNSELDFVIMTEHTAEFFDTSSLTLRGKYLGVLFVNGQEVDTASGDRFLMIPGHADSFMDSKLETADFIRKYKSLGRLIFVTYPERLKSKEADFDGFEFFSLNTNARRINPGLFIFDAVWSWRSYSELLLTKYFARPDDSLRLYDELTAKRKVTLFAGSDAHSNIGFFLLGDDAGNKVFYLKLDPYERVFRLIRNHVLVEKDKVFNEETLLEAIKRGRLFVGVDLWGDTRGFRFMTENGQTMGDEIEETEMPVRLKVLSPLPAKIVLLRNGEKVSESYGTEAVFDVSEKGAYRAELYLDLPTLRMPWIISNPIYVR